MKPPLTIGFNVPFHEAIAAAQLRGVVLPDRYYGELQGIARQLAFSIAGIASLDQLQAVKDSLSDYMAKGGSFNAWKKQSAQLTLELPAHRLDNIWRTNLQGNYMRGKWEQFQRNADTRPYLLYDAINDSRVRPSHLAMDGTIRRWNDPWWKTHSPPCGFRCRCSLISLSEEQAQARSGFDKDGKGTGLNKIPELPDGGGLAQPDKGWDYNPFEDRMQWAEKALERFDPKLRAVGEKFSVANVANSMKAIATLTDVKQFLVNALEHRSNNQTPLVLQPLSKKIYANLAVLGAKPRDRVVALDHDNVLHIHDSHGLDKELLRGQIPITAEDLMNSGELLEVATSMVPGKPSHSKNGAMRVVIEADDQEFRYSITFEVRRHYLVPLTMYKFKR